MSIHNSIVSSSIAAFGSTFPKFQLLCAMLAGLLFQVMSPKHQHDDGPALLFAKPGHPKLTEPDP